MQINQKQLNLQKTKNKNKNKQERGKAKVKPTGLLIISCETKQTKKI